MCPLYFPREKFSTINRRRCVSSSTRAETVTSWLRREIATHPAQPELSQRNRRSTGASSLRHNKLLGILSVTVATSSSRRIGPAQLQCTSRINLAVVECVTIVQWSYYLIHVLQKCLTRSWCPIDIAYAWSSHWQNIKLIYMPYHMKSYTIDDM